MYAAGHAAANPDQPAVIMGSSGETVSYAEYEARCNRVAHLLRAAGLKRGDHISVFMENNPRMLEIEGAAERSGLYYTLVNAYLAADEVAYVVVSGRAVIDAGGGQAAVAAGSVIFVPAGETHRFTNITEDLALLVVFGPAEGSREP